MFYKPNFRPESLPHDPFKAIVSPRPIGWISTINKDGSANLAPYSFFNAIGDKPPMVIFSKTGPKLGLKEEKDSVVNIRDTGEFAVNFVSFDLKNQMNISSQHFSHGEDEFVLASLEKGVSEIITAPFVKAAPAAFECKLYKEIELPGEDQIAIIGEVKGIHLNEEYLKDGIFDVTLYKPLARLGYRDYAVIDELITLKRPDD
ncbi:MAG: flavin reductase family protein [Rhodobacteraceae bacterium]|nr:flavin reductase family protein [Paracoccaceae bacterium]